MVDSGNIQSRRNFNIVKIQNRELVLFSGITSILPVVKVTFHAVILLEISNGSIDKVFRHPDISSRDIKIDSSSQITVFQAISLDWIDFERPIIPRGLQVWTTASSQIWSVAIHYVPLVISDLSKPNCKFIGVKVPSLSIGIISQSKNTVSFGEIVEIVRIISWITTCWTNCLNVSTP